MKIELAMYNVQLTMEKTKIQHKGKRTQRYTKERLKTLVADRSRF